MKKNREIRAAARLGLGRSIFSSRWLFAILTSAVASLLAGLCGSFFIGILVTGPLTVGLSFFFLNLSRGREKLMLEDLFHFFSQGQFWRTVVLGILQTIYVALWSLLFLIPGIVKSYSYRLAFYLAADYPELSADECITMSRRLMHGYKKQAFLLDLSFIGWALLGMLTCGIGLFFVYPYMYTSQACFYLSLMENGRDLFTEKTGNTKGSLT